MELGGGPSGGGKVRAGGRLAERGDDAPAPHQEVGVGEGGESGVELGHGGVPLRGERFGVLRGGREDFMIGVKLSVIA